MPGTLEACSAVQGPFDGWPIPSDEWVQAGKEAQAEMLPSASSSTEQQQQQQRQSSAPAPAPSGISAGQGLRLAGLGLAFAGLAAGVYFGGKRLLASSLGDKGKQACPAPTRPF